MNLQSIRWPIVVAAMAVSLGIFFGGGHLLEAGTVEAPLREVYGSHEAVASHTVAREQDGYAIAVRLVDGADLPSVYTALTEKTEKVLRDQPYRLVVEDQPTPALQRAMRRIDLHVQEGLATGRFAAMADRIAAEAEAAGLQAEVAVDSHRVYVTLREGASYLHRVVERPAAHPRPAEGGFGL